MSDVTYIVNDKLKTSIESGKHEIINYDKENPLTGAGGVDAYQIRDTNTRWHPYKQSMECVFEQSVILHNKLDASLRVRVYPDVTTGGGTTTAPNIWSGEIPADSVFFFTSDKSGNVTDTDTKRIVGLVELRLPYERIIFEVKAIDAPTTGELYVQNIKRY